MVHLGSVSRSQVPCGLSRRYLAKAIDGSIRSDGMPSEDTAPE